MFDSALRLNDVTRIVACCLKHFTSNFSLYAFIIALIEVSLRLIHLFFVHAN